MRLCAHVGSAAETRAVDGGAEGVRQPSEAVQGRLRLVFQVAGAITDVDGAEVARAWFRELDHQLGDRSPARLLRQGDLDEIGLQVIVAEALLPVGG